MTDFAIIQTGGKQYRVKGGDTIRVEYLPDDEGDTAVSYTHLTLPTSDLV